MRSFQKHVFNISCAPQHHFKTLFHFVELTKLPDDRENGGNHNVAHSVNKKGHQLSAPFFISATNYQVWVFSQQASYQGSEEITPLPKKNMLMYANTLLLIPL